ncbi:MAG: fatty acid desaturase [Acidobacteriota bacterium]
MIEFDDASQEHINWLRAVPFFAVHVAAVAALFYIPPTLELVAIAVAFYLVRMWGIIVGYHRYFSHRSFKTSRAFQLVMALIGAAAVQKGPLWWAAHHRHHHKHSDHEPDLHSPTLRGFFWSHVGWILCDKYHHTEHHKIRDFMKYPELRWLDRHYILAPILMGAVLWAVAGFEAFVYGGLVSTVVLWHGTFTINSLAHVFGSRRFKTKDTSRNNWFLSLITLGEGWHNNHHYYPASARQGFYWWEIDVGYYSLKILEFFGVVWDVRGVPERVLARAQAEKAKEKAQAAEEKARAAVAAGG